MHTPGLLEPFKRPHDGLVMLVSNGAELSLANVTDYGGLPAKENAARFAATWNACEGIETSRLTPGLVAELVKVVKCALPLIEHAEHCEASAVDNMTTRLGHLRRLLSAARAVLAKLEDR